MKKNSKVKKVVITGGGTGGHLFPALEVARYLIKKDINILFLGSNNGLEANIIPKEGIDFKSISTGKLRRYFDWNNFIDPFRVIKGLYESIKILKDFKPDVVFSKGGFVSVPVVLASKILGIPVVLHESDLTPGLANMLLMPFAEKVCFSFKQSIKDEGNPKYILTGNPIRKDILSGDKNKALALSCFDKDLPVLLFLGGSLGASQINDVLKTVINDLLKKYQVIVQCGKGKSIDFEIKDNLKARFFSFEFVGEKTMGNLLALANVVISRAGAGQIFELAALGKASLLLPLGSKASRGDQILNANLLKNSDAALVINSENLMGYSLIDGIKDIFSSKLKRDRLGRHIKKFYIKDSTRKIADALESCV